MPFAVWTNTDSCPILSNVMLGRVGRSDFLGHLHPQIHLTIWTNTFTNLDKYI